ncbi:hypothetical protein HPB50_024594 [Hyalomma asiaticum]|uniref:Uncharacterized protein n=1 Tax=Hyalomma asiaticum TaxID=266040 RepID=A0ACB7RMZ5_HYAAI|nr:hypothetical protein HPB50_024594 [Hyalomma asiaticum]
MESKDKSSRSGSRANLNESTLPLLEDVGGGDVKADEAKEKIELELKGGDSGSKGEDSNAATAEPGSDAGGKEAGGESDAEAGKKDKKGKDKKKDKKEKKEKKASSHKRSPSCVETLTIGLNLLDRDEKHVNDSINRAHRDDHGGRDYTKCEEEFSLERIAPLGVPFALLVAMGGAFTANDHVTGRQRLASEASKRGVDMADGVVRHPLRRH